MVRARNLLLAGAPRIAATRRARGARQSPQRAGAGPGRAARGAAAYPQATHGEGHRKAHPPALADLLPDGRAPPGHRPGDPPRRRGLQRDERGRLRPALLRRPRRARVAGHPAHRRASPPTASPSRRTTRCARRTSTCPPIAFTDEELAVAADRADAARRRVRLRRAAAARAAADLLGPAQPAAARPSSARSRSASPASAGGHELSQRLAKIETAIFRHKTITFDYYTMERDETGARKVDPYHLLFQGGQFYLLGHSHERDALRVFRLSRIRGKVAYATKAEHDFKRPTDFDPRAYANRADWQFGDVDRHRRDLGLRPHRLAGRAPLRPLRRGPRRPTDGGDRLRHRATRTRASSSPGCCGLGEHARVLAPAELQRRGRASASRCSPSATSGGLELAEPAARRPRRRRGRRAARRRRRRAARPRSAPSASPAWSRWRQHPHRGRPRAASASQVDEVCERLQISDAGAARGRQRPQRRELRRRLLRPLRRGRRRRHDRGRPRALLGQLRAPRAAAAGRGQGARRRDRPDRRAPARGQRWRRAREKIVAALGADPMEQGLQVARTPAATTPTIARVVSRGDRAPAGCCASSTTRPTRTSSPSARSSPTR